MTDNLATIYSNIQIDTSYFQAFLNKILFVENVLVVLCDIKVPREGNLEELRFRCGSVRPRWSSVRREPQREFKFHYNTDSARHVCAHVGLSSLVCLWVGRSVWWQRPTRAPSLGSQLSSEATRGAQAPGAFLYIIKFFYLSINNLFTNNHDHLFILSW